jgi:hypothetical protein
MSEAQDSLTDGDLQSEIELVGELVVAATSSEGPLPQNEIDRLLGVAGDAVETTDADEAKNQAIENQAIENQAIENEAIENEAIESVEAAENQATEHVPAADEAEGAKQQNPEAES